VRVDKTCGDFGSAAEVPSEVGESRLEVLDRMRISAVGDVDVLRQQVHERRPEGR
jgi:hypothetical protein